MRHFSHCIDTGQDWEDTFPLRAADGSYRWFLSRAKAIRDSGGRIVRWFGTNTDVTEMRDAEQRIALLLDEVNHRSKNMLAVILSIARRTDSGHPDFVKRLEQRIRGLAANQDLLVSRSWSNVPLIDMIEAQLGNIGEVSRQVRMAGPPVSLSPAAAESLAMAMHEMATNSLKYGALSVAAGWIDIVWSLSGEQEAPRFELSWCESDGPPVTPPVRTGFGTRITIDVPRSRLNAVVETRYPPEGFVWTLACDPADLG
ncbi:sensor histidine kinase [Novosphingobium sp. 9]|uniref:sensor histidine kinase n=1 Tax=Novosphingobium sp. 9 TaxID=2025349 RepID=UPI0021B65568|nr:HWE histidine kinase domain-containing protein [Novosphingobium sp. 9]